MKNCLVLSLDRQESVIRASDGKEISFARAVLTMSNRCGKDVSGLVLHVSLGQEGGTVQDVSQVCTVPAGGTIAAGAGMDWDVYDRLLPAHAGTASKVHMFGCRAVLNWRFDIAAQAEYRLKGSSEVVQTPQRWWTMRWTMPDPSSGAVVLTIEEGTG